MKRFLAAGYDRVFQIGPCCRKGARGEHRLRGVYDARIVRAHEDYNALADDCEQLLLAVDPDRVPAGPESNIKEQPIDLALPWPRLTVKKAFLGHAGWDPLEEENPERFGGPCPEGRPGLDRRRPVFLLDSRLRGLLAEEARRPRGPRRESSSLPGAWSWPTPLLRGDNPEEQGDCFEETNRSGGRTRGERAFPLPVSSLPSWRDVPPSAGSPWARPLVMLFAGASHIDEVIALGPETYG